MTAALEHTVKKQEPTARTPGGEVGNRVCERDHGTVRVAYVVGGMYTEASGVARIVCDLANAVSRQVGSVPVYTAKCGDRTVADHMLDAPNPCVACPGRWMGRMAYSRQLFRRLDADMAGFDVVHNHSLWEFPNHYGSAAARRRQRPVAFTMHGTLEPWALRRSRWKKRLAGYLFQNRDLRRAACLHTNSVSEIAGLRAYGLKNPVAIVPNGVDLTPFSGDGDAERVREWIGVSSDERIVLFLSRLHEKKGLRHLIQAWSELEQDSAGSRDWRLVIVGPDDGFEETARRMVDQMGLCESVNLVGPRRGREKVDALAAADLFVLPSFSEGFSMAVLEALAASLPVLITPGCNFPEVEANGAGLIVAPTIEDTCEGLRQLMSMSDADRREMGRRGRALVERGYSWDSVATRMIELYRWMIQGGTAPDFVCDD